MIKINREETKANLIALNSAVRARWYYSSELGAVAYVNAKGSVVVFSEIASYPQVSVAQEWTEKIWVRIEVPKTEITL